jgi:hypothetical protein
MATDYKIYHQSLDTSFFEDFINTLTLSSPTLSFNEVFGQIEVEEFGFKYIILYNGVELKSSDQLLSTLYPDHLIIMLVRPKNKENAYVMYQVNAEGTVVGMTLLSLKADTSIQQVIGTFPGSQIYNSEGQIIPSTSKGLLSTFFPNNKIVIYFPPGVKTIRMGVPVQPLAFKLDSSIPETPILTTELNEPVETAEPVATEQLEPSNIPVRTRVITNEPTSSQILQRTLSPTQRRSRSPYRERPNSPFRAESDEFLHRIDPQKLSYERSTIYNEVYSTNDLIFLLVERGIEPPRTKIEMVDILYNFL